MQPVEPPVEAPELTFGFNAFVPFAGVHRLVRGLLEEQASLKAAVPDGEVVPNEVADRPAADELTEESSADAAFCAAETEASKLRDAARRLCEEADELRACAERLVHNAGRAHRRLTCPQSKDADTKTPARGPTEIDSVLGKRGLSVDYRLPPFDVLVKRVKRDLLNILLACDCRSSTA